MRYTKQIIFLLFLNLIIVLVSIFTGNLSRKLELTNNKIQTNIEKERELLKINSIEYTIYNNTNYLKQLHNIYFSFDEVNPEEKIISFSSISNSNDENIVLVNIKSK